MPPTSSAVTVIRNGCPAVAVPGTETTSCVAGPCATLMLAVTEMDESSVSVAVTVWVPAVLSVTEKTPAPLVSVVSPGKAALPSVLVKWTVPG